MKKLLLRISEYKLVFISVAFLVFFSFGCVKKDEKEIKIGAILPLTGRAATYGERSYNGIKLALKKINNSADITKTPINIIVEDSQSQAQSSISAFQKLISVNKVPIIIGLLTSDEALSCAPIANKTRTVLFSPGASSTDIKFAGDFVFRNRESSDIQADVIAKACIDKSGGKDIAILHANAANAISYRDSFINAVKHLGFDVTNIVVYNEGNTDYRAEIEKLRVLKPKAVYLAGYDTELGIILKQCRELGFKPDFYASAGAISNKLLEIAQQGAEGLVCATAPFNAGSEEKHIKDFVSAFTEEYGEPPDWLAANSYDAVIIIAHILNSGARSGDEIKKGLYATRDFPGVSGNTTFDEYGEVVKPIELVIVEHSCFTPLRKK